MTSPALSIVIPAYNEARRLPSTLERIIAYLDASFRSSYEIIVVDDGSSDGTPDTIDALSHGKVRVLRQQVNQGKGSATRRGVLAAHGTYVLCTDADLSTPIEEAEKLYLRVARDGYDVAIGSRTATGSHVVQPLYRRALSRASNVYIRLMLNLPYRDTQCGFKLYRRDAARLLFNDLTLQRFGFDYEVLARAAREDLKVAEVGVRWIHSDFSTVRFSDVIQNFFDVFRIRFGIAEGRMPSRELLRFMAVGVINTAVDTTVYFLLTRYTPGFAGALASAKFLSFLLATISSFFLNRFWTFGIRTRVVLPEVVRFYASTSFALGINVTVLFVLTHYFGMYDLLALIFATGASFATNYLLARRWVFGSARTVFVRA